ncbi:MAG: N-acetylmuramoyl-L-alanine amidase, partial [Candidatus Eremiobacteraeota bacterium]|nr:N-acetylmuramoyl-L-alanine amidase [Candidatus Eremiobacteraeota bacterium]
AHTYGRNSFAAGISVMAMKGAVPSDFGDYPLTDQLVDALCCVGAAIVRAYGIPVDETHVLTHAEAAIADGYFGEGEGERWDIARLHPDPSPLTVHNAIDTGAELRRRIAARAL